jgi:catechol 2,3-dioxygenase-like lactoylglutathione lyase family enzyme
MFRPIGSHVGIYSPNVESLRDWYRDVLGFRETDRLLKGGRPPIYFLEKEGLRIEILPSTKDGADRGLDEPGLSHMAFQLDDFSKAKEYLESRGILIEDERRTTNGWRIGYFQDIENNWIELFEILADEKRD